MTSESNVIGLLHPGRMGAGVGTQLRGAGSRVLWCPEARSADTLKRAEDAGLEPVAQLADLLERCDVLLAICPPAAAEDVADQVASLGFGGLYVEANAISPERVVRIADRFEGTGARVVDACIFGPPPTESSSVRFYASGPSTEVKRVIELFGGTRVRTFEMGGAAGQASALKLTLSSYQKVSRALAAVAFALADHHGIREEVLAEAERFGRSALTDPEYLPSVAARAWRWEPEMAEVAETLGSAGLPDGFAHAAAVVFERWRTDKDDFDVDLDTVLSQLR